MKTNVMKKYIFPLIFILAACSGEETNKSAKKEDPATVVKKFANEAEMDNRIVEIDALISTSTQMVSSMKFQKDDGTYIQVLGHMNRDNQVLKMEEQFSDGEGKNLGVRYYYLNGGVPFATQELIDEAQPDGTYMFVDRISYYDAKGKVLKTKERRASYAEETEKMKYKPVALKGITIDRAMRALNSKKEFACTFQGLITEGGVTYLIVGENNKNNPMPFTAALRCDYKDPLILQLSSNPEGYLGEPLKVNFEFKSEQNFEYMSYTGGDFAE
jgi:hypothetical protein